MNIFKISDELENNKPCYLQDRSTIAKKQKQKQNKTKKQQQQQKTSRHLICFNALRGYCTPNQKLACFVLYLKVINIFLKNNTCILKQIVQGTQKMVLKF